MTKTLLAEYFGMHITSISRQFNKGVPYDEFYDILEDENLTRRDKKNMIYGFENVSDHIKDSIWERYCGDKGFDYSYDGVIMKAFKKIQREYHEEALCASKH